jgi:hypothetical protein
MIQPVGTRRIPVWRKSAGERRHQDAIRRDRAPRRRIEQRACRLSSGWSQARLSPRPRERVLIRACRVVLRSLGNAFGPPGSRGAHNTKGETRQIFPLCAPSDAVVRADTQKKEVALRLIHRRYDWPYVISSGDKNPELASHGRQALSLRLPHQTKLQIRGHPRRRRFSLPQ